MKLFRSNRSKKAMNVFTVRDNENCHSGKSIVYIINKIKMDSLEKYVCKHFKKILCATSYQNYHYFLMYNSWKALFLENAEIAFEKQQYLHAFKSIIKDFPELEVSVYEYLLDGCIADSFDCNLRNEINISDDILIPLSHIERSCGTYFSYIREDYKEILESTTTFDDFYAVAAVLNNEFDIPEAALQPIVDETISETIDAWLSKELNYENFESLIGFFQHREAYEAFMDNIYELFTVHGLSLYCFLIKAVGPRPEILEHEYFCYEFIDR